MDIDDTHDGPAAKRPRLDLNHDSKTASKSRPTAPTYTRSPLRSLDRAISPPVGKPEKAAFPTPLPRIITDQKSQEKKKGYRLLPSPIQLTRIRDLPADQNVDTVGLKDILGDPMIKECWQFNYLFDLDFLMGALDEDVRDIVQVKVIHGSWKKEDMHRLRLEKSSKRYPNLQLITAHMPEAFGTHHSKLMILLRHDDAAQIVIHTANMIPQDWANLTQAVWRSPLLPLLPQDPVFSFRTSIGSGTRFKSDLFRYLSAYGARLRSLTSQLQQYDFSSIRAAFLASTPSRARLATADPERHTAWGWPGLREILDRVPAASQEEGMSPNVVVQVSSIATLGQTDKWLSFFQSVLARHAPHPPAASSSSPSPSLSKPSYRSGSGSGTAKGTGEAAPTFNLVFPTSSEIRRSLDGYASGASIHLKLQSAAQQAQLRYLHPLLCRWAGDPARSQNSLVAPLAASSALAAAAATSAAGASGASGAAAPRHRRRRAAHRGDAAPHIKTYIRFSSAARESIDWAMVTSANLSTQAWGALEGKDGAVRVCSWEVGVVVWPGLFKEDETEVGSEDGVRMVPVFGRDWPNEDEGLEVEAEAGDGNEVDGQGHVEAGGVVGRDEGGGRENAERARTLVGFRMPYDLPLTPYAKDDVPWCATAAHEEPDWKGRVWS